MTCEAVTNRLLPVEEVEGGPYVGHSLKPTLWRSLLAGVGYAAVLDRHAVLTGDIGQQIAVLRPDCIRNTECVRNPAVRDALELGGDTAGWSRP